MRRLAPILFALSIPFAFHAHAQDPQWELSESLEVAEIGYTVAYPAGWTVDSDSGSYMMTALADDISALADTESATSPTGVAIQLVVIPLAELGVEPTVSLDSLVENFIEIGELEVTETGEVPVAAFRAIYVVGLGFHDGRDGAGAIWTHNGNAVVVSFSAPNAETRDTLLFDFGRFLGSIQLDTTVSEFETYTGSDVPVSFAYPVGWIPVAEPGYVGIFELESDIELIESGSDEPEQGLSIAVTTFPLDMLELTPESTSLEAANAVISGLGLGGDLVLTENLILEQRAFTLSAVTGTETPILASGMIWQDQLLAFLLSAPTVEARDAFYNDWSFFLTTIVTPE